MSVEVVVVAHPNRRGMAQALADRVGASAISWDSNQVGAAANHQQAWRYLMDLPVDWGVILEDDAEPVLGFRDQLSQVLAAAPADIVSLYLGRGRPDQWQLPISSVISQDVCFLRCSTLFHGVGYAVRTPLLRPMLLATHKAMAQSGGKMELVDAMSAWAKRNHKTICYSRPSQVNHRDGQPVIADEDREDGQSRKVAADPSGTFTRRAWMVGTHSHWQPSYTDIPLPDLRRKDKVAQHLAVVRMASDLVGYRPIFDACEGV